MANEPREGTEAYLVQEQVKKIKQVAENKKVKELIGDLYFRQIEYFPSWIKRSREYVPSIISNATEGKAKDEKNNRDEKTTKINLNGKEYKFTFQENSFSTPDNEYHTHGLLKLFLKEEKILALNCSLEISNYDSAWSAFSIEAFIDGDWIEDFRSLKAAIEKDKNERAIKEAENPEKTEKLKRDFGIK